MSGYPASNPYYRFMAKVCFEECWIWNGAVMPNGYGYFFLPRSIAGRDCQVYAHKWSYEYHIGPIPKGMEIDHLCKVRNCVNPFHLELVTHEENMRRGYWTTRQTCTRGHQFDERNTWYTNKGQRHCRECRRQRDKANAFAKNLGYSGRSRSGQENGKIWV